LAGVLPESEYAAPPARSDELREVRYLLIEFLYRREKF